MPGEIVVDWTLRFGDILTIGSVIGAGIVIAYRVGKFTQVVSGMKTDLDSFKKTAESVVGLLTTVAVQKTEIQFLHQRIDELRHGIGFVQGPRGVDKEY